MFVVHAGTLTMQLRVDKKTYWVLSRETFAARSLAFVDTQREHTLTAEEFAFSRTAFQPDIDTTRYLLQSQF